MTTAETAPSTQPHTGNPTAAGIVVGIDGSSGSEHALRWAVARADRFGPVRPVSAWQYPFWAAAGPHGGLPLATIEEFEAAARRHATEAVEAVPTDDRRSLAVYHGPAGPALVEAAVDASLIVVGTRGRGAVANTVLGSVSSYVVAHASVPTIVVPRDAVVDAPLNQIVVGVDGSPNSVAALRWAATTAPADAVIEAVYVWSNLVTMAPAPYVVPIEPSADDARTTLTLAVDEALEGTGVEPSRIRRTLRYGDDARNVLRDAGDDADLLVVGARGRGGVAHLLLGSVTTSLVHHPRTVTAVVPIRR